MKRINLRLASGTAAALLLCSGLASAQSGATRPRRVTPVQPTGEAAASVGAPAAAPRAGAATAAGSASVAHAFTLLEQKQYEAALAEAKQLAAADP
ncbi:MAG TPA: hypothetical protein VF654_06995, partial [Pyrinomonadaceae bacterium]